MMRDQRLAVHEAGHGILGDWCGLRVKQITIEPTDEFAGHVNFQLTRDEPRVPAMVSLGGFAAEVALLGNSPFWSVSDRSGVRTGEGRRAWYDAYRVARRCRVAIQQVANRLLEVRTMTWPVFSS